MESIEVVPMDNMEVWDRHFATDPSSTKTVPKGGRKITAIDTYARIKDATKEWGPIGNWGLRNLDIKIDGRIAYLSGEFFTPHGAFGMANTIDTHMKRGQEFVPDPEWGKKLQTDTMTKALSYLGFSADVFFGMFDDSRYVEERQAEEAKNVAAENQKLYEHAKVVLEEKKKLLGDEAYTNYKNSLEHIKDEPGRVRNAIKILEGITAPVEAVGTTGVEPS